MGQVQQVQPCQRIVQALIVILLSVIRPAPNLETTIEIAETQLFLTLTVAEAQLIHQVPLNR